MAIEQSCCNSPIDLMVVGQLFAGDSTDADELIQRVILNGAVEVLPPNSLSSGRIFPRPRVQDPKCHNRVCI